MHSTDIRNTRYVQSTLPRALGDTGLLIVKVIGSPSYQTQKTPPPPQSYPAQDVNSEKCSTGRYTSIKTWKGKLRKNQIGSEQETYITVGITLTEYFVNVEKYRNVEMT